LSERLEARAAIEDLVHRYAANVRAGNAGQCGALFTEDATFEVKEAYVWGDRPPRTRSRWVGQSDIAGHIAQTASPERRVCPLIYNLLIDVNGHEATSSCVMISIMWSNGHQIAGEYQDTFRYDTQWRFSSRTYTIMGEFLLQPVSLLK
jgi:hypothetical protein